MTQIRFLGGLTTTGGNCCELVTPTGRVVVDLGADGGAQVPDSGQALFGGAGAEVATAVILTRLDAAHAGGLQAVPAAVPVYAAAGAALEDAASSVVAHALRALPDSLSCGGLTVTALGAGDAVVVADAAHRFVFVGETPLDAATRSAVAALRPTLLALEVPQGATPERVALCQALNPRVVVPWHTAAPEAAGAVLDDATRAEVLLPEWGLYYSLDEPEADEEDW
ncbi:hypothetical protein [Lacticaseibacillus kribbianus]|uniref:hypothetical protein n=1 Tax=Lacticaseibacillus kribbianus TaxID=2926292 RepID=UPI001CD345E8|nr:hypothetical protein [Lacticaseibacillus kribbianus]